MIALAMVYVTAVGGLCAAAAACAERATLLARRPARVAWVVGLVGSGVLPAAQVWMPRTRPVGGASLVTLLELLAAAGPGTSGRAAGPMLAGPVSRAAGSFAAFDRPLAVLWAVLAAAAMTRLALRAGRTRRALADATRLPGAHVRAVGRARVLVSDRVGPAALGGRQATVVLPHWVRTDGDAERRRFVFAHEAEHVRAGDPRLLGAAAALVALTPWSPAGWWMLARLRAAVELDCDARVLARAAPCDTSDARVMVRYGTLLLDVAARPAMTDPRAALTPALAGSAHTTLERRIRQMTAPRPARAVSRTAAFALGTALCAAAAFALPQPRVDASALRHARTPRDTVPPDGANVSAGDVLAVLDVSAQAALQREANHVRSVFILESHGRVVRAELTGEGLAGTGSDEQVTVPSGSGPHQVVMGGFAPGVLGPDSVRFVWVRTPEVRTVTRPRNSAQYVAVRHPRPDDGYLTESTPADSILVLIDGRVVGHGMAAAKAISPDSILSVDVLKGQLATTRYGAEGRNGVVIIVTTRSGG